MGAFNALVDAILAKPGDVSAWRAFGVFLVDKARSSTARTWSHLLGLQMSDDFKAALAVGVLIGFAIIAVLKFYPGEPFDYDSSLSRADMEVALEEATAAALVKRQRKPKARGVDEEVETAGGDEGRAAETAGGDGTAAAAAGGLRRRKGGGAAAAVASGEQASSSSSSSSAAAAAAAAATEAEAGAGADAEAVSAAPKTEAERRLAAGVAMKRAAIEARLRTLEEVHRMGESLKKNVEMRKLMGIEDDAELDAAIEKTKREAVRGGPSQGGGGGMGHSAVKMFDSIFYFAMIVALFYFANRDYGFNVLDWLGGVFPKEAGVIRRAMEMD